MGAHGLLFLRQERKPLGKGVLILIGVSIGNSSLSTAFAKQKKSISYHAFIAFSSLTVSLMQTPTLRYNVNFIQNGLNGESNELHYWSYLYLINFDRNLFSKTSGKVWVSISAVLLYFHKQYYCILLLCK